MSDNVTDDTSSSDRFHAIDDVDAVILSIVANYGERGASFNEILRELSRRGLLKNRRALKKRIDRLVLFGALIPSRDLSDRRRKPYRLGSGLSIDEVFERLMRRNLETVIENYLKAELAIDVTEYFSAEKPSPVRYFLIKTDKGYRLVYVQFRPEAMNIKLRDGRSLEEALGGELTPKEATGRLSQLLKGEDVIVQIDVPFPIKGDKHKEFLIFRSVRDMLNEEGKERLNILLKELGISEKELLSWLVKNSLDAFLSDKPIVRGSEKVAFYFVKAPEDIVREGLSQKLGEYLSFTVGSFTRVIKERGKLAVFFVPEDHVKMIQALKTAGLGKTPAEVMLRAVELQYKYLEELDMIKLEGEEEEVSGDDHKTESSAQPR